jgi:hypothetical protein
MLALWVTLGATGVGALVAVMGALSGGGACGGPGAAGSGVPDLPADAVCSSIARTVAERAGLVTALVTAVVILTAIGLSRLASDGRSRETNPEA